MSDSKSDNYQQPITGSGSDRIANKMAPGRGDIRKVLAFSIAILAWFAVIIQYDLMLANRTRSIFETTVRFFSFFTILTNSLVAVYFSFRSYGYLRNKVSGGFGTLTAITVYITIVGLVYQIILRHAWTPTGMQMIVDELLHSVNPVLVIIYWFLSRRGQYLSYRQLSLWLVYPLVYLVYVLIRGHYSGFFPYPFLNIPDIGLNRVVLNSIGLMIIFILISMLFIRITTLRRK